MGSAVAPTGTRRPAASRRQALVSLVRSLLVAFGIVAAYAFLPMSRMNGVSMLTLATGLALVAALVVWHIREIRRSSHPRLRAVEALATTVVLFLTIFSTTYYLMSDSSPGSFNEPLNRLDSAYFTVTVFATVGFGDITATTQSTRAVVIVQMLGDLALIGIVARILVSAVGDALGRQADRS
ncbi:potassium channel family protein [Nocardioides sp. MAHUQ-72]|uniref:potassium channel family protein n=1 Tax=unclassified Nocardioides TaxID=2615069 RepID=UPI003619BD13